MVQAMSTAHTGTTLPSQHPLLETFYSRHDSERQVSLDIALLSYLLTYTKVEGRVPRADESDLSALNPWIYLSYMVNTGELPHDKAGNKVVAVTGRIDREAITAALVSPNVVPRHLPPHSSPLEVEVKALEPGGLEDGPTILKSVVHQTEYVFTSHPALRPD